MKNTPGVNVIGILSPYHTLAIVQKRGMQHTKVTAAESNECCQTGPPDGEHVVLVLHLTAASTVLKNTNAFVKGDV